MLLQEFRFGNYKSFKENSNLDLSAAKIRSKNPGLDIDNVIVLSENDAVIRSKAIYGANASGKSNIITALATFIAIVDDSIKDRSVFEKLEPFALTTEEGGPTYFQIVFFDLGVRYRYGFEANANGVINEWLFSRAGKREVPLFLRDGQDVHDVNEKNFSEANLFLKVLRADKKMADSPFKIEGLFLTVLASFGFGEVAKRLVHLITSINIVSGLGNPKMMSDAEKALKDEEMKEFMVSLLKYADFGIDDLNLLELSSDPPNETDVNSKKNSSTMLSWRAVYNELGERAGRTLFLTRRQESEGTKKIIELSPLIYEILRSGGVLVVDEFDARLHPLLTKKIVETINSRFNGGAQLIFTTHDINLLSSDILRRDQIDFVEKDEFGASRLYSLNDFKGIRNDAMFGKEYILGKYGAIPFLGDFSALHDLLGNA